MSVVEIQNWFTAYLADFLNLQSKEIEVTIPFDRYGLDSSATVAMIADFEDNFQCNIDPTVVYSYSTIEALSQHLEQVLNSSKSAHKLASPSK